MYIYIYFSISDEPVHSQKARQRDDQITDISQNHHTGPINHKENDCF